MNGRTELPKIVIKIVANDWDYRKVRVLSGGN